ncbi:hypothetical protein ACTHAM_000872 [Cellulomonas soli]|uniref:hypothetical protein n=1 Tax=Cellulomonas soli TaxID=931535 RepID=UPI003F85FD97
MSDRTPSGTPDEGTGPQAEPRDEAFDRVRAADPAAGATADLDRLAATARDRAGLVTAGAVAHEGVDEPEELAEVRVLGAPRRPARWLQIAAAVAGVAIIGGGGYAIGASGDAAGGASLADAAAPAITLEGTVGAADQAAAGGAVSKLAAESTVGWWYGGRTVFTQEGLSDEGGQGKAWGFDAVSVVTQENAARLAAVLGVAGEPRQEYGSWTVGPNDGSGATVTLSADGLANMSYYDPARDPWAQCYASSLDTPSTSEGAEAEGSTVEPAPAECVPSGDPAPTGDAAVAEVRDVLADLGVDPDGWEYDLQTDTGNPQAVYVTVQQVVDGQRTSVSGSATLVADGLQSLYLPLATLVDLGTYDVISPVEAVERLADPRFGPSSGVMPYMAREGMSSTMPEAMGRDGALSGMADEATDQPTVPATPAAGDPIAWPVQQVTLVSARLGVAVATLPDGATVLVPTYELADADGTTWSVVAVVEEQMDFSPVG